MNISFADHAETDARRFASAQMYELEPCESHRMFDLKGCLALGIGPEWARPCTTSLDVDMRGSPRNRYGPAANSRAK